MMITVESHHITLIYLISSDIAVINKIIITIFYNVRCIYGESAEDAASLIELIKVLIVNAFLSVTILSFIYFQSYLIIHIIPP